VAGRRGLQDIKDIPMILSFFAFAIKKTNSIKTFFAVIDDFM
jgi:hypothetical protein